MAIVFDSDAGTITGLSVGGLPDGTVDAGTLATNSVTAAKIAANSVDSAELVDGAVDDSHMASISSRKNLIINGAMQLAQRGTSATGIVSGGYNTLDRFSGFLSDLGTWTVTQDTSAPEGFANSIKYACTTAAASPAAGGYVTFGQRIEAQNAIHLKWGTSNAQSVTLSFWVKSSKTGTHMCELFHDEGSSKNSITYTINSANTWEKKELTFVGNTSIGINNDNGSAFRVYWVLAAGSDRTSGTHSNNTWHNTTANRYAGQVNLADSTSNTFYMTGAQLEVGSTATDFEHRGYGEELALCQRYYYLHATKEGGAHPIGSAAFQTTNFADFNLHFPTTMRTKPTLEYVSGTDYYSVYANDQLDHFSDFTTRHTSPNAAQIYTNGGMGTGITAGKAGIAYTRNDNAFMAFTAEL